LRNSCINEYEPRNDQELSLIPELSYMHLKKVTDIYAYPLDLAEQKQNAEIQKKEIEDEEIFFSSFWPNKNNLIGTALGGGILGVLATGRDILSHSKNNSILNCIGYSLFAMTIVFPYGAAFGYPAGSLYKAHTLSLKKEVRLERADRTINKFQNAEAQFRIIVDQTKTLLQDCIEHPEICKEELAKNRPGSLLHNIEKKFDVLIQEKK
jgi:hypothetical protein